MNGNLMVLGAALLTAGAAFGGRIEAVRGEVSVRSGEARELWSLSHAKTGEAWSFAAPVPASCSSAKGRRWRMGGSADRSAAEEGVG